jgi:hypothetical protein
MDHAARRKRHGRVHRRSAKGFLAEAEWVKAAPDWEETQKRMIGGIYAYLIAKRQAAEGKARGGIARDLKTRLTLAAASRMWSEGRRATTRASQSVFTQKPARVILSDGRVAV